MIILPRTYATVPKKIHIRKESVRNLVGKFILHHGEKDKPINRTQRTGLDFLLMGGYAR